MKKATKQEKVDLYVWNVKLEECWSYDEPGEYKDSGREYDVVASTAKEAEEKAIFLSKLVEPFFDEESNVTHTLVGVRVIELVRNQYINA